tara:strand:+ start:14238 stop:18434 length:4197 start_codon:yes stop_codon:yes gene_type:complete
MINMPPQYKDAVSGNISNISRVVRINGINISDNRGVISDEYYEDRSLKISTIKQSVDLSSRKFKIGNVNITMSNFEINGTRFSDMFSSTTLMNKPVEIYFIPNNYKRLDAGMKVFEGKVRRFVMDGKQVNIQVEDASQEKMHKELPLARVSDAEKILEQYRNIKVPMVFGYNDKSPLYYYKENVASNEFTLLPDNNAKTRTSTDQFNWGGRIPLIKGFKTDLEYGEEPLRAFKGDWIEIPVQRTLTPTEHSQYSLEADKVRLVKDTTPLEALHQQFIDEELTNDEFEIIKFQNMSPISNNVFEGYTILKPESFTILDEYLAVENYPDVIIHDTYYMGPTGVNNNAEIVNIVKLSEDKIDFTFPEQQESTGNMYTGIRIGYWRENQKFVSTYFDYDWYEGEYYYHSSMFGSGHDLFDLAQNGNHSHPGGWWITVLPSPVNIHYYLYTYCAQNNIPLSPENGCLGGDPVGAQGYGPQQWRYYRTPQNSDPLEYSLSASQRTGHSCGVMNEFKYNAWVSGLGDLLQFQMRNNIEFCKWWFGVDADGNLGAPTDEQGRGYGPVLKEWQEINDYSVSDLFTMNWYHEFASGGGTGNYVQFDRREKLMTATEFYRWNLFAPLYSAMDMRYNAPDNMSQTSGADYQYHPICLFNPHDLTFHTAGEHVGLDASDNIPQTRMSKTGFFNYDMGYEYYDDPNFVTIKTEGDRLQAVRFVFNFPDLETKDVLDPFMAKDEEDNEYMAIQTYYPNMFFKFDGNLKCNATSSSFNNFYIRVDNLPDFYKLEDFQEGDEVQVSNSSTSLYQYPGQPQHEDPKFIPNVWKGPNDHNEIGVTFMPQQSPAGNREVDVNGRIHDVHIKHTCNYNKLDKTKFYGRVEGRQYFYKINPSLNDDGVSYDVSPANKVLLNDLNSEYWNLYPLFAAAFNPNYDKIESIQQDESGEFTVDTEDGYVDKVSIWDFFFTGVKTLNQKYEGEWTLFGPYGGVTGSVMGGMLLAWGNSYVEGEGDSPVTSLINYINGERNNYDTPSEDLLTELFYLMCEAFEENLKTQTTLISNPIDIIGSLLYSDLNFTQNLDIDKFLEARTVHESYQCGFTISEDVNSKDLIEKIASNTRVFPKLRPSDGSLSFVYLKENYEFADIDEIINSSDILNYKYSRTKMDDVKNNVRVVYKPDPGHKNYEKKTEYIQASNFFPDYSTEYYSLETDTEDTTLDFESDFIRDEQTANQLRDFLCMYHCNQKLSISMDVPLKYCHLESGDIVYIDELPENVKAFGKDITTFNYTNGQIVFPYFIIEEVSIKERNVSLKMQQLHYTGAAQPDFESYLESIGFDESEIEGIIDSNQEQGQGDIMAVSGCTYPSAENYNPEAVIDDGSCTFSTDDFMSGDINGDGFIDLLDIVLMINMIIGED